MPSPLDKASLCIILLGFALVYPALTADPSTYVDRAAVERLADKLSTSLHDFACNHLRTGQLQSSKECKTPGLKQLFESLKIKPTQNFTPDQFLVKQILPQIQSVLDTVRRFSEKNDQSI